MPRAPLPVSLARHGNRPNGHPSSTRGLYLPEPVYEALRKIAFEERLKIHDVVLEGIDIALRRRGYPSIEDLKVDKKSSSTKMATFRC